MIWDPASDFIRRIWCFLKFYKKWLKIYLKTKNCKKKLAPNIFRNYKYRSVFSHFCCSFSSFFQNFFIKLTLASERERLVIFYLEQYNFWLRSKVLQNLVEIGVLGILRKFCLKQAEVGKRNSRYSSYSYKNIFSFGTKRRFFEPFPKRAQIGVPLRETSKVGLQFGVGLDLIFQTFVFFRFRFPREIIYESLPQKSIFLTCSK